MTTKLVLAGLTVLLTAMAGTDALTTLKNRFNGGGVFRAEMSHTYVDAFSGDTTMTYGSIWLARDGYKIETANQVILVHKQVSRVYNRKQKKLILSRYSPEDDDFAPSRFLGTSAARFTARESRSAGRTLIDLTFTDPFDLLRSARIELGSNSLPTVISAVDQADNRMSTRFEFGRFIADSTGVFRIQLPAGIETIDLRDN